MLKLVFTGVLLPGFERDQVIDNLAQLLEQSPANIRARLFAGHKVEIKRVADDATADRWCQGFARAGAVLNVVPEEGDTGADAEQSPTRSEAKPRPVEEDRRVRQAEAATEAAASPPGAPTSSPEYAESDNFSANPNKQRGRSRRRDPLLAGVILLLVLAFIAAGLWYARPLWQSHSLDTDQQALMNALAADDVYALAHINVEGLLSLEQLAGGETDLNTLPGTGADFWSSLEQAGIDPRRQLKHAWFGAYAGNAGEVLLVLTGEFQPERAKRWLEQRYIIEGETEQGILFTWLDSLNCEKREPIMAVIEPGQILLGNPERIAALRARLSSNAAAAADLHTWRPLADRQLASLAVLVPENLSDAVGGFAGMMLSGVGQAAGPATGVYLGLERTLLPPGVSLSAHLASEDQQFLDKAYAAIEQNLTESRAQVAEDWPDVAQLYERLSVERESNAVEASLRVDRNLPDQLSNLITSRMSTMFTGFGGGEPAEEQLEENPPQFAALLSAELAPYSEHAKLSSLFRPQATAGPFAVRTDALEVDDDGGVTASLRIQAFNLPNLGEAGSAITARITGLASASGASLMPEHECGDMGPSAPAEIDMVMAGSSFVDGEQVAYTQVQGHKRFLLPEGVNAAEVARVEGVIDYQLPLRIERETLQAPLAGQVVEKHGLRLRFSAGSEQSVSYQISGQQDVLLHVQGLNAAGQPLASRSSSSRGMMLGSGRNVNIDFQGEVAAVEVILASEMEPKSFRFTLDQLQPVVVDPMFDVPSMSFEPLDASQWQALQNAEPPEVTFQYQQPEQTLVVGPALLAINRASFDANFGMNLEGEIYLGNQIPLVGSLATGELVLNQLTTAGGASQVLDQRAPFGLKPEGGFWSNGEHQFDKRRPWLKGEFQFKDRELDVTNARSLKGELVIYGPTSTETVLAPFEMGTVWQDDGLQLTIQKWNDYQVYLTFSGDLSRIVSLSAIDAEGESASDDAKFNSFFGETRIELGLTGQPAQLQLKLATEMRRQSYPFALQLTK